MSPLGHPVKRWGPLKSFLALAPLLIGAPLIALKLHYTLPRPVNELTNSVTGLAQISEAKVLEHAKYLSEDIGWRIAGNREHALGDAWMVEQAEGLKRKCDEIVKASGRALECEVWRQEGSGYHRFDMMGKRVYKAYVNLTNIIVRLSNGTDAGKEHALLINAHVDSTLTSPGAADDAMPVGVMLECIRVLIHTPDWSPEYAAIFLFNNAEESFQDGSQLFSTQHSIRHTVRAVINLEAAGTTGRELLFQASSEQMIQAYAHVPRPFGTIIANEVFSSGIILSDTDFRQFESYLNVTGLDFALIGNSYLYHMRKDLVENIQPGSAQHMADNVFALIRHLTSVNSPLPSLTTGFTRPETVFFSYLGHFFVYSYQTAKILYSVLLVTSIILVRLRFINTTQALEKKVSVWGEQAKGIVAMIAGTAGALIVPNLVAIVMSKVLNKGFSWFSHEYACFFLYGPPTLVGAIVSQILTGRVYEHSFFSSILLTQSAAAVALQFIGIASSAMFFLSGLSLLFAILVDFVVNGIAKSDRITLWAYVIGQINSLLMGSQIIAAMFDFFVPLTGRIGADIPADNVIASLVTILGGYSLPLALPFIHRMSRRTQIRLALILSVVSAVSMSYFAARPVYDPMHQKRVYIVHFENTTSHETRLNVAAVDGASGFEALVQDLASEFGSAPAEKVAANEYNADWDSAYPFSAFMTPYSIALPPSSIEVVPIEERPYSLRISTLNDVIDEAAGTRSFTLQIDHPGMLWTVIALDAYVLEWSLDDNPPTEYTRHHIKQISFYGTSRWSVDLVVKLPETIPENSNSSSNPRGAIPVNLVGIREKAMWPGKKAEKEDGGRAMELFEKIDTWVDEHTGGTVDVTFTGSIGGLAWI